MSLRSRVVLQFANQLLISRMQVAADEYIGSDAISDVATSRYKALISAAHDAAALLRRQTAPPAIAEEVIRELNGREQPIRIVRSQPLQPLTESEILDMAVEIQTRLAEASAASQSADEVCLAQLLKLRHAEGDD